MSQRDFSRMSTFLDLLSSTIYEEPPSEPHITITNNVIDSLFESNLLQSGMRLLDIGCGQGGALEKFIKKGILSLGITMGKDFTLCANRGLPVMEMDQSFLQFPDSSFDFVWARHVLEHSPMPLFTLYEYKRVMAPDATLYVEVPAPDTFAHHERNPNHFSIMSQSCWISNFIKAGFQPAADCQEFHIQLPDGEDIYYSFLLEKATPDA